MILDHFTKIFQVQTSKTSSEIVNEIEFRSERQQKRKLLLMTEPVNYRRTIVNENSIVFERRSNVYNRLKGVGKITFTLKPNLKGTLITCIINPTLKKMLLDSVYILISLLVITFIVLKDINQIYISTIIFLLITWIVGLFIGYFSLTFNTKNLESYSQMILKDLGLISD